MKVNILNYIEKDSIIHKLCGTSKLVSFLVLSFAYLITYDTRVIFFILIYSFICLKISKIKFKEISFMLKFLIVFLIMNAIFLYLFNPHYGENLYGSSTVIFKFNNHFTITLEQLFYQFNVSLKYFIAFPLVILFISTTNPSEFAASLSSIGVPYKVSYALNLALRYIPDVQDEFIDISKSQMARGIKLGKNTSMLNRLKNSSKILLPLVLSSLNKINKISDAMELRNFSKMKKRTWYMYQSFKLSDYIYILLSVLILLFTFVMLYFQGRFYNPFI